MKVSTLSFVTLLCIVLNSKAATTYTLPAGNSYTVGSTAAWYALPWGTSGSGTPNTYVIPATTTVKIGVVGNITVDLSAEANLTLQVDGNLGFYSGNKNLTVSGTSTITIGAGGQIGWNESATCCLGTAANTITVGTSSLNGPFSIDGPATAIQGGMFSSSTFWIGGTSSAWATAGNWDNNLQPSATINAVIPDATTTANDPVITTSVNVRKLVVQPGGLATVNSGGGITLNNDLDNLGTVTVKSGGSLVQTTSSGIINAGTVNVERAIPGGVSFVSSPISNVGVNSFGITTTGTNGAQILTDQTNPCNSYSVDPTSPYGNLMELHENAGLLTPAANCAQELWFVKSGGTLTNGRGYSLTNGATTLTFSGTPNNGAVSYAGLTNTGGPNLVQAGAPTPVTRGWHLVGNPYPSPITITAGMLTGMGFDAQVHLYNHNGNYTGTWVSYPPIALPVTIAVGQSFQIRNSTGGPLTYSLSNSNRTVANPTFYKTMMLNELLKVSLDNGVKTDTTMIWFDGSASDNFDPAVDANRMADALPHPMIYSVVNNEAVLFNGLPTMNPGDQKTVDITIRIAVHGAHTLGFYGLNNLTPNVIMEDRKLNVFQPVFEGMTYPFTTVSGESPDRFRLHFNVDATTAVHNLEAEGILLTPNPVSSEAQLLLPIAHSFSRAVVTDLFGREVLAFSLTGAENQFRLNFQPLPSGIYLIKLEGSGNHPMVKFVKE